MQLKDRYGEADQVQAEALVEGAVATELLVHGVGGALPTDLLDDFHPTRVSGDRHAGFYRPQTGPVRPAPPGAPPLDPVEFPREAFAWGGLTSADAARSLWFLLLPYALMNMAGWMLPRIGRRGWKWSRGLARVLAALGTVTLVLASAHLSMDLLGYQCGWLIPSCRERWWLSFLEGSFWSLYPSRIIVLGAAIPLLVLAGVWAVGLLSFRNFEEYVPQREAGTPEGGRQAPTDDDLALEHPWFWKGEHPVRRLRRLHFQLGVVIVAVVLGLSIAELTTAAWPWPAFVVVWGGTAVALLLIAVMARPEVELSGETPLDGVPFRRGAWIAAVALLGLAAWYGLFDHGTMSRAGAAPRLESFIPISTLLTATQLVLGIGLAVVVWKAARGSFLRFGPAVAHALGWFMIMSLWAGLGIRMADWLESGQADSSRFWITDLSTCTFGSICYPIWFEDAAVAVTLLLAATLVLGGVALARRPEGDDGTTVADDFGLGSGNAERQSRRFRSIAFKLRYQRIVAGADAWMAGVVLGTLVLFLVVAVVQDTEGWRFWPWLVTASGWVVALVPLVTVLVVRAGLNNATTRRAIGAVFDVVTFFPRRVHPFAPPCYGERAVPQLRWRLGYLAEHDGLEVSVLARSHSQGTVVTAAAILQGADHPQRVWLLTCGSPMVTLYQRHFPYYFHDIVDRVAASMQIEQASTDPRWLHVTAATDALGAPLRCDPGAPPTQVRVLDPTQWGNVRPGDPPPPPLGHGCYHRHPVVDAWVVHQLLLAAGRQSRPPEGGKDILCPEPVPAAGATTA